jgi:hypothetical protein
MEAGGLRCRVWCRGACLLGLMAGGAVARDEACTPRWKQHDGGRSRIDEIRGGGYAVVVHGSLTWRLDSMVTLMFLYGMVWSVFTYDYRFALGVFYMSVTTTLPFPPFTASRCGHGQAVRHDRSDLYYQDMQRSRQEDDDSKMTIR